MNVQARHFPFDGGHKGAVIIGTDIWCQPALHADFGSPPGFGFPGARHHFFDREKLGTSLVFMFRKVADM